jgi:cholesterol transport system auxiliary component
MPRSILLKFATIAIVPILLSACVKLGGAPTPAQLLTLSAPPIAANAGVIAKADGSNTITITDPNTPHKLDTSRIPVQVNANSIAYVTKAQWVDTPRRLFRNLLADTISVHSNGSLLVLHPGQHTPVASRKLTGDLIDFGIDEQSKMAIVTYEATLIASAGNGVQRRRFTASAPVKKITGTSVAAPLNKAAQQVANDVAIWVQGN